jgi:hypothetical protein
MANAMNREEYLSALKELGVSQQRAAWLFNGKSARSGRRWAREGAPYHVALIIALMQEFELTPEHIEALGRQWRNQEQDDEEDYYQEENAH